MLTSAGDPSQLTLGIQLLPGRSDYTAPRALVIGIRASPRLQGGAPATIAEDAVLLLLGDEGRTWTQWRCGAGVRCAHPGSAHVLSHARQSHACPIRPHSHRPEHDLRKEGTTVCKKWKWFLPQQLRTPSPRLLWLPRPQHGPDPCIRYGMAKRVFWPATVTGEHEKKWCATCQHLRAEQTPIRDCSYAGAVASSALLKLAVSRLPSRHRGAIGRRCGSDLGCSRLIDHHRLPMLSASEHQESWHSRVRKTLLDTAAS